MATGTSDAQRSHAGDALPPALAELLAGLAEADPGRAAAAFFPDAVYAAPAVEDDEVAPRAVGAAAGIPASLSADPRLGKRHVVRVCCVEGTDCLVEGLVHDGSGHPI